jgi:preprotein translocase subunit SecG
MFLKIAQLVVAILLILVILLQNKGAGLSKMFGGSNNVYLAKRGVDKTLFNSTVVLAILFATISILMILPL